MTEPLTDGPGRFDPPYEAARPATTEDIDFIVELARAHAEQIADQRGAELFLRREVVDLLDRERLRHLIETDDGVVVIGSFDEVPFGYAAARIETLADGGRLGRVEDLLVEEVARGLGIGESMMNKLVAELRAAGCFGVDAAALPGDRNTKNFFESFGLKARLLVVHHRF